MKIEIPDKEKAIMQKLLDNGHQAWIVGGYVRDMLLGKKPSDIDIFTDATGDMILKVFPHGKVLGNDERQEKILTVIVDGVEVSQFRSSGDRKETGNNLPDHCRTCDFTINAIAIDITGKIIDHVDGIEDLSDKYINFVGSITHRTFEDELRMLRLPRIALKVGKEINEDDYDFIRKNVIRLNKVAPARIHDELIKIFRYDGAAQMLYNLGILNHLFRNFVTLVGMVGGSHHNETGEVHSFAAYDTACKVTTCPLTRIAVLLHDYGKPATQQFFADGEIHFYGHENVGADLVKECLKKMEFSNKEMDFIYFIIKNHMYSYKHKPSKKSYVKFFAKMEAAGVDILDYVTQIYSDHQGNLKKTRISFIEFLKGNWLYQNYLQIKYSEDPMTIKDMKISGAEVMKITKEKPGPVIGKILAWLFDNVMEGKVSNKNHELVNLLTTSMDSQPFLEDVKGCGLHHTIDEDNSRGE